MNNNCNYREGSDIKLQIAFLRNNVRMDPTTCTFELRVWTYYKSDAKIAAYDGRSFVNCVVRNNLLIVTIDEPKFKGKQLNAECVINLPDMDMPDHIRTINLPVRFDQSIQHGKLFEMELQGSVDLTLAPVISAENLMSVLEGGYQINIEKSGEKVVINSVEQSGGFVAPYDFGTANPSHQTILQRMAHEIWDDESADILGEINYVYAEPGESTWVYEGEIHYFKEMFNGTKIVNLYDNTLWVLSNTPTTNPPVFAIEPAGYFNSFLSADTLNYYLITTGIINKFVSGNKLCLSANMPHINMGDMAYVEQSDYEVRIRNFWMSAKKNCYFFELWNDTIIPVPFMGTYFMSIRGLGCEVMPAQNYKLLQETEYFRFYKTFDNVETNPYFNIFDEQVEDIMEKQDVATYYISEFGNDNNDGLSWQTAKATLAAVVNLIPTNTETYQNRYVIKCSMNVILGSVAIGTKDIDIIGGCDPQTGEQTENKTEAAFVPTFFNARFYNIYFNSNTSSVWNFYSGGYMTEFNNCEFNKLHTPTGLLIDCVSRLSGALSGSTSGFLFVVGPRMPKSQGSTHSNIITIQKGLSKEAMEAYYGVQFQKQTQFGNMSAAGLFIALDGDCFVGNDINGNTLTLFMRDDIRMCLSTAATAVGRELTGGGMYFGFEPADIIPRSPEYELPYPQRWQVRATL